MKLTGDETGIAILKELHSTNNEFLKFLLQEAKTNFGNSADFKSSDEKTSYRLLYEVSSGEFKVEKL